MEVKLATPRTDPMPGRLRNTFRKGVAFFREWHCFRFQEESWSGQFPLALNLPSIQDEPFVRPLDPNQSVVVLLSRALLRQPKGGRNLSPRSFTVFHSKL
jgi:hypothetical protein